MSAFACEPGRGSEQEVGWRWALEMSRSHDVTVITQTRNKPGIESVISKGLPPDCSLKFIYHQLPEPLYRLKSRFDPLTWPYYFLWQSSMIRLALSLHRENPFDLAHHVTFVSFRVPVSLKQLGIPVVFGPVGGADIAPYRLLGRGFGPGLWCKEVLRNLLTGLCAWHMRIQPPLNSNNGLCLAATPAMKRVFDWMNLPSEVFPAVGMDPGTSLGPRKPGPIRFLFVGRFHPLKGTHLLLEAFARLDLQDSTLSLIGAGKQETKLRLLATKLGIADRLRWHGRVPRAELAEHFRRHDVLVAPSLYESGGLVALEAMAEGVPPIVLDVGGHSVSVTDGCGIKVAADGSVGEVIHGLTNAMRLYATEPDRIRSDGERARLRISNEYCWRNKADRMNRIYKSFLQHNHNETPHLSQ